jgi:hypothetical protein
MKPVGIQLGGIPRFEVVMGVGVSTYFKRCNSVL